jgi:2-polyprenyl-6-methoxyphenol hydroxylase-like FAD-dependent oxidoreductase
VLVGADGVRSVVRRLSWPQAPGPRYAGYLAYRLLTPPMPGPEDEGAETWGAGVRFGYVPLRDGRVYCFAAVSAPPGSASATAGDRNLDDLEALVGSEDAVELGACLATEPDVPAALAGYDRRRRPRAQGIARRSRTVGQVAQWSAPPLVAVRDLVTRLTPPGAVRRGLGPVLSWEPPASPWSVGGPG